MSVQRWMAAFFAVGSACFLIGPFPGYANLVGGAADGSTFFIGSILFTTGGALQCGVAWPGRHERGGGRAAWWGAIVQFAGTLLFNVTTYQALQVSPTGHAYDRVVWGPDWMGSVCFLLSGAIAYHASRRGGWRGLLPIRRGKGWWQPGTNLLGCVFFGISAVASYVVPSTGSMLSEAWANWSTVLGAACFLACAIDTLQTDRASKMPLVELLRELEHVEEEIVQDVREVKESL